MQKRKFFILPLVIFLLLFLESGVPVWVVAPSADNNPDQQENKLDPFMTGTLLSGPTNEVPWENDADFIDAKNENNCPILMAAYKTVLKDPLPGEEDNVHLAAQYISGTVLVPGAVFSQNGTAGPYTGDRGYREGPTYTGKTSTTTIGGGVCKIASTLFNVVILSDLEVVERHTHSMPVPYVPYGQDATVSYGAKDFRFKNNTQNALLIWAKGIDNILYIGIYGQTVPPQVTWSHEVIAVYKAPIYTEKNKNLPAGTENVLHEGMDGADVTSTITFTYADGTTKTVDMGQTHYNALPWMKEVGG